MDDVSTCGKQQFLAYAAEIQITDKTSLTLNPSAIETIFSRANQVRAAPSFCIHNRMAISSHPNDFSDLIWQSHVAALCGVRVD